MNAPNPSSAAREFGSLHSPEPVVEPSVEDILAEIRRSIMTAGHELPATSASAQTSGSQIAGSDSSIAPAAATTPAPQVAHLRTKSVASRGATETESNAEPAAETPFTSPATEAAVVSCFDALFATVAMQGSGKIEGLMREMLRPMLKNWLDDNLPAIVGRLVRAEIQRVARSGH